MNEEFRRGVFNNVMTYNYQLDASTIAENYAYDTQYVYPLPSSGGFQMTSSNDSSNPPTPGASDSGTNSSGDGDSPFNSPQFSVDQF